MFHYTHSDTISSDREMLVRFCARFTGNTDAAEDLAQQTLLQAWRHEESLRDPQARQGWLLGIARNTCLMWARRQGREVTRLVELDRLDAHGCRDRLADNFDFVMELERDELVRLVERAMALLPSESREILIQKYVEELPQVEVAARLGLTEGAVEARLQRGKQALKRLLSTDFSAEAVSYGLIHPADAGWEETRVWCPVCGRRRLEGRFKPQEGELFMRCPECAIPGVHYIASRIGDRLRGMRTYGPAVGRVLDVIHDLFRSRPIDGMVLCSGCGEWRPIVKRALDGSPYPNQISLTCPQCKDNDHETWHSLTWSLPEARLFWRENPRMRFLPDRQIEVAGSPAILTGFESLTSGARLEVVTLLETLQVLSIRKEFL